MWYVIQVKTGEESGIARKLKNQAIRAEVPIENRPIRSGGAWTKKEYILFRICVPGHGFHGQKLLSGKRGSGSDPVPGRQ